MQGLFLFWQTAESASSPSIVLTYRCLSYRPFVHFILPIFLLLIVCHLNWPDVRGTRNRYATWCSPAELLVAVVGS